MHCCKHYSFLALQPWHPPRQPGEGRGLLLLCRIIYEHILAVNFIVLMEVEDFFPPFFKKEP